MPEETILYAEHLAVREWGNVPYAVIDLVVTGNGRLHCGLQLCKLYDHERDLNRGRFEHYTRVQQNWKVRLHVATLFQPLSFAGMNFERYTHLITTVIEWIVQHGRAKPWSVTVVMSQAERASVTEADFMFSFEDDVVAVLFKLVWL